jgi:hypothetical protein
MLGHAPTIRRGKAHRVPYLTIGRFPCLDVVVDGVEKAQFLLKQRPDLLEARLSLESPAQPGEIGVGDDKLTQQLLLLVEPPRLAYTPYRYRSWSSSLGRCLKAPPE